MDPENATPAQDNQAASAQSSTPGGQGVPMVEKHRLDKAMQKIEELTLANRALSDEVVNLKALNGQASAQLSTAASEMKAKTDEFTAQIAELTTREQTHLEKQKAHEALLRKMKAINDLGAHQLFSIIDVLPTADTDEAQIEAIKSIATFAKNQVTVREKELTAGLTNTTVVAGTGKGEMPKTSDEWARYIESQPLGSEERQKASDAWFASLQS